jgi:TusA-related sulfurtransferase
MLLALKTMLPNQILEVIATDPSFAEGERKELEICYKVVNK